MGGIEDLRVLDPDGEQGVDVEEAAEVELLRSHPPEGQPVVLLGDAQRQRQRLGTCTDREDVVKIGLNLNPITSLVLQR